MKQNNKKVLVALPMMLTGGTEVQTLYLVKALRRLQYEVVVCCYFEYEKSVVSEFEESGAKVELLKLNRNCSPLDLIRVLYSFVKSECFRFAHVQYVQPGFLPVVAFKLANIERVFLTVHQPADYCSLKAKILFLIASKLSYTTTCVSNYVRRSWFGTKFNQKNKTVVYNCISDELLNFDYTTSSASGSNKSVVFCIVGRLRHEKGQSVVLSALKGLLNKKVDVKVVLIGDGPDRDKLEQLATEFGVREEVEFLGNLEQFEIAKRLGSVDVSIIPSKFEGFGLVAIEAMAAGVPILASRIGALEEVIGYGGVGEYFTPTDDKELEQLMLKFALNAELRKSSGGKGKVRVNELFSFDEFVENIRRLYS